MENSNNRNIQKDQQNNDQDLLQKLSIWRDKKKTQKQKRSQSNEVRPYEASLRSYNPPTAQMSKGKNNKPKSPAQNPSSSIFRNTVSSLNHAHVQVQQQKGLTVAAQSSTSTSRQQQPTGIFKNQNYNQPKKSVKKSKAAQKQTTTTEIQSLPTTNSNMHTDINNNEHECQLNKNNNNNNNMVIESGNDQQNSNNDNANNNTNTSIHSSGKILEINIHQVEMPSHAEILQSQRQSLERRSSLQAIQEKGTEDEEASNSNPVKTLEKLKDAAQQMQMDLNLNQKDSRSPPPIETSFKSQGTQSPLKINDQQNLLKASSIIETDDSIIQKQEENAYEEEQSKSRFFMQPNFISDAQENDANHENKEKITPQQFYVTKSMNNTILQNENTQTQQSKNDPQKQLQVHQDNLDEVQEQAQENDEDKNEAQKFKSDWLTENEGSHFERPVLVPNNNPPIPISVLQSLRLKNTDKIQIQDEQQLQQQQQNEHQLLFDAENNLGSEFKYEVYPNEMVVHSKRKRESMGLMPNDQLLTPVRQSARLSHNRSKQQCEQQQSQIQQQQIQQQGVAQTQTLTLEGLKKIDAEHLKFFDNQNDVLFRPSNLEEAQISRFIHQNINQQQQQQLLVQGSDSMPFQTVSPNKKKQAISSIFRQQQHQLQEDQLQSCQKEIAEQVEECKQNTVLQDTQNQLQDNNFVMMDLEEDHIDNNKLVENLEQERLQSQTGIFSKSFNRFQQKQMNSANRGEVQFKNVEIKAIINDRVGTHGIFQVVEVTKKSATKMGMTSTRYLTPLRDCSQNINQNLILEDLQTLNDYNDGKLGFLPQCKEVDDQIKQLKSKKK